MLARETHKKIKVRLKKLTMSSSDCKSILERLAIEVANPSQLFSITVGGQTYNGTIVGSAIKDAKRYGYIELLDSLDYNYLAVEAIEAVRVLCVSSSSHHLLHLHLPLLLLPPPSAMTSRKSKRVTNPMHSTNCSRSYRRVVRRLTFKHQAICTGGKIAAVCPEFVELTSGIGPTIIPAKQIVAVLVPTCAVKA